MIQDNFFYVPLFIISVFLYGIYKPVWIFFGAVSHFLSCDSLLFDSWLCIVYILPLTLIYLEYVELEVKFEISLENVIFK